MRNNLVHLSSKRWFGFLGCGIAILVILFTVTTGAVYADSPVIRVGLWDGRRECPYNPNETGVVYAVSDIYDLDTFTRDALAGEVFSNYHTETLKANAVMIRSVAEYYARHPQSNWGLCNTTGLGFNLRTSTIQGWSHGRGALDEGLLNNVSNDRVTDTGGQVIFQNQQRLSFQIGFNRCLQQQSEALIRASSNPNYVTLLTDANHGLYNGTHCGYAARSGLSIQAAYPFRNSLTNGTSPRSIPGSSQTAYVTPAWHARQAEAYWGHSGIEQVNDRPFNQSGFYMAGWHLGDKVEYLMEFGGIYENLHLIGISDAPGPVTLNIYIDGYFKRSMQWTEGDNRRHLRVDKIPNISQGTHAIAIEFANDYCVCKPYAVNTDRNFYFDVLGVNNGPINRASANESPFFSSYALYLPLLLK